MSIQISMSKPDSYFPAKLCKTLLHLASLSCRRRREIVSASSSVKLTGGPKFLLTTGVLNSPLWLTSGRWNCTKLFLTLNKCRRMSSLPPPRCEISGGALATKRKNQHWAILLRTLQKCTGWQWCLALLFCWSKLPSYQFCYIWSCPSQTKLVVPKPTAE